MVIEMGISGYGGKSNLVRIDENQINQFKQELLDAEKKDETYLEKESKTFYALSTDLSGIDTMNNKKKPTAKKKEVTAYDLISIMKKHIPEMNKSNVELEYCLSLYSSNFRSLDEFKNIGKKIITTHNIDAGLADTTSHYRNSESEPGIHKTKYDYFTKPSSHSDPENNLETYLEKLSGVQPPTKLSSIGYDYDLKIADQINKMSISFKFEDSSDGEYAVLRRVTTYPYYIVGFGKIMDPIIEDLIRNYKPLIQSQEYLRWDVKRSNTR